VRWYVGGNRTLCALGSGTLCALIHRGEWDLMCTGMSGGMGPHVHWYVGRNGTSCALVCRALLQREKGVVTNEQFIGF
jgi:hypothetical protein